MSSLIEMLSDLRSRGVELSVEGDRLQCNAPKGVITPEIREQLAKRKHEILNLLKTSIRTGQNGASILAHSEDSMEGVTVRVREQGLSRAQRRLWFLDQMDPGNPVYNIVIPLQLDGSFDRMAFEEALQMIIDRHESLRTRFLQENGLPYA